MVRGAAHIISLGGIGDPTPSPTARTDLSRLTQMVLASKSAPTARRVDAFLSLFVLIVGEKCYKKPCASRNEPTVARQELSA